MWEPVCERGENKFTARVYIVLRGLVEFIPIARFSVKEHCARVEGRAIARHPHGRTAHAVRCATVKVSAESADAVASNVFRGVDGKNRDFRSSTPDLYECGLGRFAL